MRRSPPAIRMRETIARTGPESLLEVGFRKCECWGSSLAGVILAVVYRRAGIPLGY